MAEGLRIPITVDFKNSLQKLNEAKKYFTDLASGADKSLGTISASASAAASALTPLAQAAASAKSAIIAFGEGKGNIEQVIPLFQELVAQAGGIDQAFEQLQDIPFFEEFVRGAEEAVLAAERLDGKDVKVDVKSEGIQSVKTELRQANIELQNVIRQFGEASPQAQAAAARVEELGDVIEAARRSTEGADFAGKFALAGKAISGVSAAFQTATALQAVFGSESKKTEEALKKVQAVMALTQGIQGVVEAQKAFTTLGAVAANALKGIKTGIAATGIGLLLVALGTIVAYWDEIKEAVSGVSEEQEKLIKTQSVSLKLREQELESIDNTEETLKRQGKSEKEILQIKAQKVAQVLKERQELLKTNIEIRKAQVEAAERNFTFTKGIIMMLTSPLQVILGSIDIITSGLKRIGAISDEQFKTFGSLRQRFTSGLAGLLFDPKEEKEAADKATAEDKKALDKLQNQYDGYLNDIDDLDKQAAEKRKKAFENLEPKFLKGQPIEIPVRISKLEQLNQQLSDLKDKQLKVNTALEFQQIQTQIDAVQGEIDGITSVKPLTAPVFIRPEIVPPPPEDTEKIVTDITDLLNTGLSDAFAGIGESIGQAFSEGGDIFAALGNSLLSSLGSVLIGLGKQIIAANKLIDQAKLAFGTPILGVLTGVALVALGNLLKSQIAKKTSKGFATGGFVDGPGTSTSDSIPARLSKGEYVINAKSVRKLGRTFFDRINAQSMSIFSEGGLVTDSGRGVSRALVNRSITPDFIPYDFSRALVNRPAPNIPTSTGPQIIATTKVSGQDLKIILERADRRYSNVT